MSDVTLPCPEEILRRLGLIDTDGTDLDELYFLISQEGGSKLVPQGVVLMLVMKITKFSKPYPPIMELLLMEYIPQFIDKLVDDNELAEAAKLFYKEVDEFTP